MANQAGYIFKARGKWYGRFRETRIVDGQEVRKQVAVKLADVCDRYRTESTVRPLLAAKLVPANEGRTTPQATLTLGQYWTAHFLPDANPEGDLSLSPSTIHGYKGLFRMYIAPHAGDVVLRDFRCKHVTDLLQTLFREHNLSKKSLRNVKGLLSSIFLHAKRAGAIDGENPVTDAGIPRKAKGKGATHAYSVAEVAAMLGALDGSARLAVALIFGLGLRPGEARGARWNDYTPADNGEGTLSVHTSIWRKFETVPKTVASIGLVPVPEYLAAILAATPRTSEFILAGPSGKPINLANLARRAVRPGLKRCPTCHLREDDHGGTYHPFRLDTSLPAWAGWYAGRRGAGTTATTAAKDQGLAAKSLLRHSNIATAQQHYIQSVPAEALAASQAVNAKMMTALAVQGDASRPN